MSRTDEKSQFPWHYGVFDAHCHPTDTLSSLESMPNMRARVLTVMATRAQDQELVARAADEFGISIDDLDRKGDDWRGQCKIVPAFGWHPWFSHQMYDETDYHGAQDLSTDQKIAHYQSVLNPRSEDHDFLRSLPAPQRFGHFLGQTRDNLNRYPLALIGEIGLDKAFRIPEAWLPQQVGDRNDGLTPGGREGRKLSPYRVNMDHQKKVLLAQLRLAGEVQRAVSLHGVQAHGILYDTLAGTWKGYENPSKKQQKRQESIANLKAGPAETEEDEMRPARPRPFPPRICLHSYSGPPETVKQYTASSVPCHIYFSFSTTINGWSESGDGKVEAVVRAVPDESILIESDLHTAGDRMDQYLEEAARKICQVKGWDLDEGVQMLGRNWRRFVFGDGSD